MLARPRWYGRAWFEAVEYGLIAAGISVAIIAVVNGLGTQLGTTFTKVTTALAAHN